MKHPVFFCADWGTSSFRIWALAQDGEVLAERRNDLGMAKLAPAEYDAVLEDSLAELGALEDAPVVICGMAGSAQGWQEARYIDLPADLAAIPSGAVQVPSARRDVRILPGLAQRDPSAPDVIRGEETLILGAVLHKGIEGTLCLPGTHSKWARVEAGTVTGFSTAMTGEVFALLATRSTLAHFITSTQGASADGPAFSKAVREAIEAPEKILNLLFSVRATPLLMGGARADEMPARLSGLLIGLEIAGAKGMAAEGVTLIAGGALARNYGLALSAAAIDFELCDAEEMVRAGLYHAARSLWPDRLQGGADSP